MTRRMLRYKLLSGDEFWLNALTGAADTLSTEVAGLVEGSLAGGEPLEGELLARLKSRGYIYASQAEEAAAFDSLVDRYMDLAAGPKSVRNLIVCPTYSCNLRCVYCFEQRSHHDMPRGVMDLDTASAALRAFEQIRSGEADHRYAMGLFGGEPLMPANRRVVAYLMDGANHLQLPVVIVSNGVNIPGYLSLLNESAANIQIIQLTVDGPREVHDRRRPTAGGRGTFNSVAASISMLLERGIKVVMRINIDRGNVGELPRLAGFVRERGWDGNENFKSAIAPVRDHLGNVEMPDVTSDAELLSLLLDVYDAHPGVEDLFGLEGFQVLGPVAGLAHAGEGGRRPAGGGPRVHYCEANHGGFRVAGPDGLLYPCPEAIGQPRLAIGRFMPHLEIWQEELRKWEGRSIKQLARCRQCSIGPLCGGGCTYASMARGCGNGAPEPVCDEDLPGAVEVFIRRRVLTRTGQASAS